MQDLYPYLSAQTGFNGQAPTAIESLLSGGPAPTSGLKPFANASSIGADNGTIAADALNSTNSIFNLVQRHIQEATMRAQDLAQKRAQADAEKRAAALQAKILKSQKDAALKAVKNLTGGSNSSGNSATPPVAMPLINTPALKLPKSIPEIDLPDTPYTKKHGGGKVPLAVPLPTAKGGNKNTKAYDPNKSGPQIAPPAKKKPVKRDPRKPGIQN